MSQLQVTGEAKIRDIQGPVVANDGVVTALDGAASQYVRGDGTLADFPTSTGGGSSVSYYLNSSVSQGTIGGVAYRELSKDPIIGTGTDIAISSNGYVANYITDVNDPDVVLVPGGNFNCEFYFSVNNNTGNPFTYAELYKYDGTTFTLLGSSVGVPEYINQGTIIAPYYFAIPVHSSPLALTDRLAIRIYVNVDGRTVTLHTENGHLCQVVTTLSKGMVSLNNLTDQSQYLTTGTSGTNFAIVSSGDTHTFNLPVASATNTGKLSSTDWTTFNAKQTALNGTGFVKIIGTTISYDNTSYLPLSGGTLTGNLFLPANNTLGGTNFYIGQIVANNDYWRIYGNTLGSDRSEMVFHVGDNAQPSSTTGQRFRFFYDNINDGTARDVLIIDYNDSTFLTTLTANSFIKSGGTSSQFLKADGSIDSSTYLTTTLAASTYLTIANAATTYLPSSGASILAAQSLSSKANYIGQTMANNDQWRIYGYGTTSDMGEMVFEVFDNGNPFSPNGQRFRFSYDNSSTGVIKDVFIIDYNEALFNANLTATSFIKSGGTSSQFLKADGSIDSNTYLTTSVASSTYLPLSGGTLTGTLNGTSAAFSNNVTITASTGNSPLRFTSTTASSKTGYLYADAISIGITDTLNAGVGLGGIFFNSTTKETILFNNGNISLSIASSTAAIFTSSVTAKSIGDYRQSTSGAITGAGLFITNSTYAGYGLLIGNSYSFGDCWIQAGRVDGSTTNYNISLNASGGNILVGTTSNNGEKLQVSGNLTVSGSVSKGSGSFKIDHPLESMSETHQLVHSFVEAPQADLYYRGKLILVNGRGQANIDKVSTMTEGTFEALCREVQCFTTNESGWDLIKGKVIGNIIYIESQNINSTDEISWLVIGERKDKHMMDTEWTDDNGRVIVEPLKQVKIEQPTQEEKVSIV
ncbi:hypothetical protein UFOVP426_12 [uncultured Caudovirales phage]|uniref:Intramolecular chaperone auto-processing domain containing protein n=1 Tax=uncultured Caudovirales phage TaxID=2100421 RepID=A0A6J5M6A8_9CAUD|nr:hypothetical protein UFOVP426_12 [uncultured Caudovirales phage]